MSDITKSTDELLAALEKFNAHHDERGRFSTADGANTHTISNRDGTRVTTARGMAAHGHDHISAEDIESQSKHMAGQSGAQVSLDDWKPEPKQPPVKEQTEDEKRSAAIQAIKDKIGSGIRDEQHAIAVGSMVHDEVNRRLEGTGIEDKRAEHEKMGKAVDEARAEYRGSMAGSLAQSNELFNRYNELSTQRNELGKEIAGQQREAVHGVLSDIREMGGKGIDNFVKGSSVAGKHVISSMSQYLPASWNEAQNATPLKVKSVDRGYSRGMSEIGLSGEGFNRDSTALHELAHRSEKFTPQIRDLEEQFYARRTAGERTQRLRDVTGHPYSSSEVTKVDKFADPYIGKDYSSQYGMSKPNYEVMSMGVEGVYNNKHNVWTRDKEHTHFTMGVLAGVK